jgi:hypothetical protein
VLNTTPGGVTLARFDGGTPALVEAVVGKGRVLTWATSLDLSWNDLPLKPVYLPFVHQLIRQASGYTELPGWRTVGQAVDVSAGGSGAVVLTPSGQRRAPADGSSAIELAEPGFYEVRDAREAERCRSWPATWTWPNPTLPSRAGRGERGGDQPARQWQRPRGGPRGRPGRGQEQAQRIWWYCCSRVSCS